MKWWLIAGLLVIAVVLSGCTAPDGNGSPEVCTESWSCAAWGDCSNGLQTRTCVDSSNCGTIEDIPNETQSCVVECAEEWDCAVWGDCVGGLQTRTCTELNNCGTTENKPLLSQACESPCVESWVCAQWSDCISGLQTRTCTDSSACGTTANKPATSQSCVSDMCSINSDCDDGDHCTMDQCFGSPKECSNTAITSCTSNDGCCPPGCSDTDIDCGEPDLLISSVSPNIDGLGLNDSAEFLVTVTNNGDGPASTVFNVKFEFTTPMGGSNNDGFPEGWPDSKPIIPPGQSETYSFSQVTLIHQGEYTFKFTADDRSQLTESNENNNEFSKTITIS